MRDTAKLSLLKSTIRTLIKNDSDPIIRLFCSLVEDNELFFEIAELVFEQREYVEEEHFVFLVFVSLQYLTQFSYDDIEKINKNKIYDDFEEHKYEIIKLCIQRNVSTNVPARYIALQIISSIIYEKQKTPLTIVDIGCSLGLGLMALNTKYFIKNVNIDDTALFPYLQSEVDYKRIIGIDVQKPDIQWVLSSYLPEAKKQRDMLVDVYDELNSNGNTVEIIRGNALSISKIDELKKDFADIVWISNTCYQVEGDNKNVIEGIGSILKDNGCWLYAYYRHDIQKKLLTRHNPYVISAFIKGRNWTEIVNSANRSFKKYGMEVLRTPDEIVRVVKTGGGYRRFLKSQGYEI